MVRISEQVEITIRIVPEGNGQLGLQLSGPTGEAAVQVARDDFLPAALQQQLWPIGERRLWAEDAMRLGRELFTHLFPPPLDVHLERARALAGPEPLRLFVQSELPEVAAVPWELLYDPRRRLFLALDPATGLVRQAGPAAPAPEREPGATLRILALHVAPVDAPTLELEAARQALEEALSDFAGAGQVSLDFLPAPVTAAALQQRLAGERYDVLYFAGHTAEGALLLEDEQGRGQALPAEQLRQMLQDRPPYLVVLSADQTATPAGGRRPARRAGEKTAPSLAVTLVQAGIPLVVGMQTKIGERAAAVFDVALFGGLAEGLPVDRAVTHARRQLYLQAGERLDWVAPVLYTAGASLAPLLAPQARATVRRPELAGMAVSNVGGLASVDRFELSSRRMNVQQAVESIGPQTGATAPGEGAEPPAGARPAEEPDFDFSDTALGRPGAGRRGLDAPVTGEGLSFSRYGSPPLAPQRRAGEAPAGSPPAGPAPLPAASDQITQLRAAIVEGRQTPRQKIETLALVERLGFATADGDTAAAQQLLRAVLDAAPTHAELVAAVARQLNLTLGGS